jgi:hypothetical protein
MERDKKRQTDRHMTRDLECQEFQKRGERKREREREREKERETSYRCVCISICTFSQSLAPLFLLSLHMWISLSLSLSLSLCVCTNVDVYSYVVLYSSLPPLFLSLSHRHTHTVEQSKIIDVKQLLDCGQKKCPKRASWKHAHARASSHAQTRAHKKGYKLTEYTSLVCLV